MNKETWFEVFETDSEGFTQTIDCFDTEQEAKDYVKTTIPEHGITLDYDEWYFDEKEGVNKQVNK